LFLFLPLKRKLRFSAEDVLMHPYFDPIILQKYHRGGDLEKAIDWN
jgi:hypothetical protein